MNYGSVRVRINHELYLLMGIRTDIIRKGSDILSEGMRVCTHVWFVCGFRPISWKSVRTLNRGCNRPVISHVHRKVCSANWGVVYLFMRLIGPQGGCSEMCENLLHWLAVWTTRELCWFEDPSVNIAYIIYKDAKSMHTGWSTCVL